MKLRVYLEANWEAVRLLLSIGDTYIPGAIYYRLTEMDFDDFVVKTFISKKLTAHENFKQFKEKVNRKDIKKMAKRMFKVANDYAFIEHTVSKTFVLENWKTNIDDIDAFEKYLREEASICIMLKSEDKLLPPTKGKENLEKALALYKKCGIGVKEFRFAYEEMRREK